MTHRLLQPSVLLVVTLASCAAPQEAPTSTPTPASPPPTLELQTSGTTKLLQAVSPVDTSVVWISGHGGTWLRTADGGRTWTGGVVPNADSLEFRDVHAVSASEAWLLSAGPGDRSRVYHTADAGRSWQLQWTNAEPAGFYDCMSFWDALRGVVYGDSVDGLLRILRTDDGGRSWRLVPPETLPKALPGEGGFAASGTCVATGAGGRAWIAAGNAPAARVFRSADYGATWSVAEAPVVTGEGAGLASISMVNQDAGFAFGGNLGVRDQHTDNVVRTTDGGRTWSALPHLWFAGAAYGGTHVPGTGSRVLVAVGPGGADVSMNSGGGWTSLDTRAWWGIASAGPGATWIAGPEGRIARIRVR